MIVGLYSILDSKVGTFGPLYPGRTDAEAIRQFKDWVNDGRSPNNQLFNHPEDFALYRVGEFDDDKGMLSAAHVLSCLVTASAVKDFSVSEVPKDSEFVNGVSKKALPA